MGKFVNPKIIKGQDKLNRIKDLMGQMNTLTESKSLAELELIKKGPNGVVYGIIRENHDYFIKTSGKTSGKFLAEDFNYVGGLQNKYEERYKSYAEAIKHLNMKFDMLNESFGIKENNNIFESDGVSTGNASGVSEMQGGLGFVLENPGKNDNSAHPGETCDEAHPGQTSKVAHPWTEEVVDTTPDLEANGKEILDEEEPIDEKTVLKVDAPTPPPAPAPEPMAVEDEVEVDEFGGEEMGDEEFGAEEEIDVEGDEEEGDEYTKKIQKLTGKVGQMLRDKDEPDSELDKYVINSIVSAIDWEEIDDEDVEDIIAKIEGEDEEDDEGAEFGGEEIEVDLDAEEEIEEPAEELAEGVGGDYYRAKDTIDDLTQDELDDLKVVIDKAYKKLDKKEEDEETPKQRKKHKKKAIKSDDEEITSLEKDKKEDEEDVSESRTFTKKSLMESFLKKNANLALKKVLKENQAICEECMGGGCASCGAGGEAGEEGWASLEDPMEENLTEDGEGVTQQRELAGDDVGFAPQPFGEQEEDIVSAIDASAVGQDYLHATGDLDRDGDKIPNRLDLDNNADGSIDHGIGNKMYDWPEHILGRKGDRDSDGIPNKYDDDVDGDGRDDDYIEVGLDDIMGNVPIKEPDIKPPTTTPGTTPRKPRWKEITRPGVDPRPKAEKNRRRASTIKRGMY